MSKDMDLNITGSFVLNSDIIAITETCLTQSDVDINGYKSVHYLRQNIHPNANRSSGGISMFVKNQLRDAVSIVKHYKDCFMVWLKLTVENNKNPLLIGITYFPPEGYAQNCYNEHYFQILERDVAQFCDEYDIICGDMNARIGSL